MPKLDLISTLKIKGHWGETLALKGQNFTWKPNFAPATWTLDRAPIANVGYSNVTATPTSLSASTTTIRNNLAWAEDLPIGSIIEFNANCGSEFWLRAGTSGDLNAAGNVSYTKFTTGPVTHITTVTRPFIGFFSYFRSTFSVTNFRVTLP